MTAAIFSLTPGMSRDRRSLDLGVGEIEVRFGRVGPSHAVYVRRRLAACVVIAIVCMIGGLAAHSALADRGGVPASIPAIRSASASATGSATDAQAVVAASTYIVQSGDTLWSVAQRFHGSHGVSSYVDTLVSANHGTALQPGQLLTLP